MQDSSFGLHPTLAADTHTIADLPLCRLLLSNDSNYPWTILVPRRANITEIYQLNESDQRQLLAESNALSQCLQALLSPRKLNIAALGNMVEQLHVHHIARFQQDKAWPAPVWGHSVATPYEAGEQEKLGADIYDWLMSQTSLLAATNSATRGEQVDSANHPTGYQLAQLNIATQQYPLDAPEMADFVENLERINQLADNAPGFVWRLQTEDGDATAIRHFGDNVVVNMSTWTDLDSLHNYVYKSAHTTVLKRRREWFSTMKIYSVMWWIKAGTQPTIEEAARRLTLLQQHGPQADAFTFRRSWPQPDS